MIVALTDIGIKRYIEQLANVTFDKDLRENPSMMNQAKKAKVDNDNMGKTETLDNITTHGGLAYFEQASHHSNIPLLKSIL